MSATFISTAPSGDSRLTVGGATPPEVNPDRCGRHGDRPRSPLTNVCLLRLCTPRRLFRFRPAQRASRVRCSTAPACSYSHPTMLNRVRACELRCGPNMRISHLAGFTSPTLGCSSNRARKPPILYSAAPQIPASSTAHISVRRVSVRRVTRQTRHDATACRLPRGRRPEYERDAAQTRRSDDRRPGHRSSDWDPPSSRFREHGDQIVARCKVARAEPTAAPAAAEADPLNPSHPGRPMRRPPQPAAP